MSTSSVGSGSVIDVQAVVNQLMQIEQRPLNLAKQRVSSATVSISAMSDLKAKLDALASSTKDVEDSRMLTGKAVSSSDTSLVKVSVTSNTLATPGSYTVTDTSLAKAKKVTIAGFASSSQVLATSGGLLTLSSVSGDLGTFSEPINLNGKSLEAIRDEINGNTNLAGKVVASIVNSGDSSLGYVLILTGAKTGSTANFSAAWVGPGTYNAGSLVGALTQEIQAPTQTVGGIEVPLDQNADDASATVNGIVVKSKTNTFTEAIGGLSFDILKASSGVGSATITVTDNKSTLKEKIKGFATNLSSVYALIDSLTKPGSADEKAGPLAGNSAIIGLRLALSTAYNAGFLITGTNTVYRWSDLGLEVQRNGSVTVREADLASAIDGATTIYPGAARRIGNEMLGGFTSGTVTSPTTFRGIRSAITQFAGTSGTIQATIDTLNTTKRSRESEIASIQRRLDATRKSLVAKYAALDTKLARGNQTLANVQSSLGSLRA